MALSGYNNKMLPRPASLVMPTFFTASSLKCSCRDSGLDNCIEKIIKLKWSSGLFWAGGAAERKTLNCHKYATFWVGFFNFLWTKQFFLIFFCPQKVEKITPKSCILIAVESFFTAALTAQNSPELHFSFINNFIQTSLVGSLASRMVIIIAS